MLHVQEPWFTEIAAGRKTVEGRVGPQGKFDNMIGGQITLSSSDNRELKARLVGVRHYPDLKSYLEAEGWEKTAPHTGSFAAAMAAYEAVEMHCFTDEMTQKTVKVFAPERVAARGGINAVQLAI